MAYRCIHSFEDWDIIGVFEQDGITKIQFCPKGTHSLHKHCGAFSSAIEKFLRGETNYVELPISSKVELTQFQRKVYTLLQEIPRGEVVTYGELAKRLNSSPRAVGQALKHNPLPLVFPCHRVVGRHSIGGFSEGIDLKLALLRMEGTGSWAISSSNSYL